MPGVPWTILLFPRVGNVLRGGIHEELMMSSAGRHELTGITFARFDDGRPVCR